MNRKTRRADQSEEDEARIDQIARQLGEQQAEELQADLDVELALALLALAEDIGLLGDAQIRPRGRDDVEQDLEADRRQFCRRRRRTCRAAA